MVSTRKRSSDTQEAVSTGTSDTAKRRKDDKVASPAREAPVRCGDQSVKSTASITDQTIVTRRSQKFKDSDEEKKTCKLTSPSTTTTSTRQTSRDKDEEKKTCKLTSPSTTTISTRRSSGNTDSGTESLTSVPYKLRKARAVKIPQDISGEAAVKVSTPTAKRLTVKLTDITTDHKSTPSTPSTRRRVVASAVKQTTTPSKRAVASPTEHTPSTPSRRVVTRATEHTPSTPSRRVAARATGSCSSPIVNTEAKSSSSSSENVIHTPLSTPLRRSRRLSGSGVEESPSKLSFSVARILALETETKKEASKAQSSLPVIEESTEQVESVFQNKDTKELFSLEKKNESDQILPLSNVDNEEMPNQNQPSPATANGKSCCEDTIKEIPPNQTSQNQDTNCELENISTENIANEEQKNTEKIETNTSSELENVSTENVENEEQENMESIKTRKKTAEYSNVPNTVLEKEQNGMIAISDSLVGTTGAQHIEVEDQVLTDEGSQHISLPTTGEKHSIVGVKSIEDKQELHDDDESEIRGKIITDVLMPHSKDISSSKDERCVASTKGIEAVEDQEMSVVELEGQDEVIVDKEEPESELCCKHIEAVEDTEMSVVELEGRDQVITLSDEPDSKEIASNKYGKESKLGGKSIEPEEDQEMNDIGPKEDKEITGDDREYSVCDNKNTEAEDNEVVSGNAELQIRETESEANCVPKEVTLPQETFEENNSIKKSIRNENKRSKSMEVEEKQITTKDNSNVGIESDEQNGLTYTSGSVMDAVAPDVNDKYEGAPNTKEDFAKEDTTTSNAFIEEHTTEMNGVSKVMEGTKKSTKVMIPELEKKLEQIKSVPKGLPVSGRWWKQEKQRCRSINKDATGKKSWSKKMQIKHWREDVLAKSAAIQAEKQKKREELKERQRINKIRREENAKKAEIVQLIKDPRKIKKMKRKQLRFIETRDTTNLK